MLYKNLSQFQQGFLKTPGGPGSRGTKPQKFATGSQVVRIPMVHGYLQPAGGTDHGRRLQALPPMTTISECALECNMDATSSSNGSPCEPCSLVRSSTQIRLVVVGKAARKRELSHGRKSRTCRALLTIGRLDETNTNTLMLPLYPKFRQESSTFCRQNMCSSVIELPAEARSESIFCGTYLN